MGNDFDLDDLMELSPPERAKALASLKGRTVAEQAEALISAASEDSRLPLLSALLDAGVPPNAANEEGETALFRATGNGNVKVVHRLLLAGADPNLVALDGMTPKKIASGKLKKLFAEAAAGQLKSPRELVDDAKVVKQVQRAIAGLLRSAAALRGHTIYVAAVDEEELKLQSEEGFKKLVDEEGVEVEEREALRHDPTRFGLSAPYESKPIKDPLDTEVLAAKRAQDNRTHDDLVAELLLANKALYASKLTLSEDFTVIAPGHAY